MATESEEQLKQFMYEQITSMVAADGELIWLRYNAMLTGNSIVALVLGAVATKTEFGLRDAAVLLATSLFGLILSTHWYYLTRRGWDVQQAYLAGAKQYRWSGHVPVFELYEEWRQAHPSRMHWFQRAWRWFIGAQAPVDWIEAHALSVITVKAETRSDSRCLESRRVSGA